MSTRNILHFGLNRSGTNYLKELLDQQFDLEFLNVEGDRSHPLHKHFRLYDDKSLIGRPKFKNNLQFPTFGAFEEYVLKHAPEQPAEQDTEIAYVIISKDPYSWHLSYALWGIKNHWPPSPHPYILEYNAFYRKWLEFAAESDRIAFVRYIDLLKSPKQTLGRLQQRFGFAPTRQLEEELRIKKVPMSRRFSKKRLNYYLREEYLEAFSGTELVELNRYIDEELIRMLGYTSHK
jgi:hypothetical protein